MEKKLIIDLFENHLNMIDLGTHFLYSDLELYNTETFESKFYKDIDELLADKEIVKKLDAIEFNFLNGGRGASSGKMGGGFQNGADHGKKDNTYSANPAEFNAGGRKHNVETVLAKFVDKYGSAKREYGVSVDEQGFAHSYRVGNAHSVSITAAGKNHTLIHNHPGGGNFSKADLLVIAGSNGKGIVATNKKGYYSFEKKHNFDSKAFTKAINKAKWPKKLSYDEGADWWLKKNAKKYGYSYGKKSVNYSKGGTGYDKVGKSWMRDDNIPLF
ncbi:hypothetical protein [Streptococcus agalactiae]|uniref:hypothetical protein n=1 Tax=Streptococcus agalactiae TaxID=1311 RepID=UPI00085C559D|nr:hypothetical protein [Streptococcus agalactiae]